MTLTIGLTYDLRSEYLAEGFSEEETAEFDRDDTITAIESTIRSLGHRTERIGHSRQLAAALVAGRRWDLVFNICEGMHGIGREAQVPALLDAYQIPYVFSDTVVCALTLHKGMTKDVVRAAATAALMSCSPPAGTLPMTAPVPALWTSIVSLVDGATHRPPMKNLSRLFMSGLEQKTRCETRFTPPRAEHDRRVV